MNESAEGYRVAFSDALDAWVRGIGLVMCWANGLLIGVIVAQVTLRYGFGAGKVYLEELQWHLYAVGVMFGVSYAQVTDSHIRVDVVATRLSQTARRVWDIFGIVVFVLPFVYVVVYHSLDFAAESWRLNERSEAPLGLPYRWAIKSVIPLSFGLLGLAALSRLVRNVVLLARKA